MSSQMPPQGPPQGQPGPYGPPPQGYYQQGPPPKKSHTVRNVFLILGLLAILFIGGCFAIVGAAVNGVDEAISEEAENDKPTDVTEGKPFKHDGFSAEAGWSIQPEEFGGATIDGLRVTLDDDQDIGGRTALLTFRLYNGQEVVGEIECSSNEMQEGETSRLDCFSLDSEKLGNYKKIRVADAF